tara:strand:+ start:97 stop:405 length:309 start_codon:yes stop_codon:yes gene_type:complete
MKNKLSMLKFAAISAYLFSHMAFATTAIHEESKVATQSIESQIIEEIKLGFADLLAEIGFPEVKVQANKMLQHNTTEQQATELVNAATAQLPEYKFKVVIAD